MGICSSSCQLQPETPMTAKLIHQDGRLQEFNHPIKVSHVINPRETFICNSDEMDFGDVASPVSDNSELQLGQLYFALPVSRLSQPLPAEEMAALAVKAHAALMKTDGGRGGKCGCRSKTVPVFYGGWENNEKVSGGVVEEERVVVGGRRRKVGEKKNGIVGGGGGGGVGRSRRKVFAANLSRIEE